MKGSRFSEEQIIGVLREHEAGAKTEEVCRRHGISSATFYKWKAKYGGLEVSEARRLKSLEDENRRLKKLRAESATRVRAGGVGSFDSALSVQTAGRLGIEATTAGDGRGAAALRVSALR